MVWEPEAGISGTGWSLVFMCIYSLHCVFSHCPGDIPRQTQSLQSMFSSSFLVTPCPWIPNPHRQHLPWALEVSKHLQSKCLLYLPWKKNMLHAFINYSFCRSESGLDLVGFLSLKVLDRVLVTSRINWWENHSQVPLCGSTLFSQSLFAVRL